jgi:TolB-like protein/Flp pilus assembly protein TadD
MMATERISRYELLADLHHDIYGSVHRARDLSNQRIVALRLVPAGSVPSGQAGQRFIQDSLAAAGVDHPAVADVFGVEEADHKILVAYEYVEGEPLSAMMGRLSTVEIRDIFFQILEGLDAAHRQGVTHGCLSPRSVILGNDGRVKITSFGLGRLVEATAPTAADPDLLAYLSPETLQGREIDQRTDLWSAGAILYEMCTGIAPFRGPDVPSLAFSILNSEPPNLVADSAELPVDIKVIVRRMLRVDPGERPSSAREVLAAHRDRAGGAPRRKSVSVIVMYFRHAAADQEKSHIAVGLTEDIIGRLSRVDRISVTPRQDALLLRGRDPDVSDVGKCMGVEVALLGTVWTAADKVEAAIRLVETESGLWLWTETFRRPAGAVFDIPAAAVASVVETLGIEIPPEVKSAVFDHATTDPKAYDFHSRGRELLTRRGRESCEAAIRMLEYSLAADEKFAEAHESLAAACSGMYTYYDGAETWLDRMERSAARSVELDPGLVEARFHLAMVSLHRGDYDVAEAGLEDVARRRPDYYEAYRWLGILSDMTGHFDEAVGYYRKSAEIKPCSVEPWLYINMTHRRRGDVTAAVTAAKRFVEVGLKVLQTLPDDPVTLSRFCVMYTLFGENDKARATLDRILASGTADGLVLYNCASTYALLGEEARSLECLRKALSGGYKNVREWIDSDPDFDIVRDSDGFRDVLSEFDRLHRG